MKVWIVEDEYDYFLSETLWYYSPEVDIPEDFYRRYKACAAEREAIQTVLHELYKDCKQKELLENSKQGVQPRGFN